MSFAGDQREQSRWFSKYPVGCLRNRQGLLVSKDGPILLLTTCDYNKLEQLDRCKVTGLWWSYFDSQTTRFRVSNDDRGYRQEDAVRLFLTSPSSRTFVLRE